jgi:tol-pal system protein YbgF
MGHTPAARCRLGAAAMAVFGLVAGGCALQADLIETRLLIDKVAANQKKLSQQMTTIEVKLDQPGVSLSGGAMPAELTTQYDQLQGELRSLKGEVEANGHTIGELRQRLDEESFQLSALTAQVQTLQTALAGATPPVARGPVPGGDEKLVLPGRTPAAKPGAVTPVEAYNLAYNDYLRGNYELAINGFDQFLQHYSTSILAPHALYWLGESYFSHQQYPKAVETFDQLIQRYPKHEKVPAAMLKNGLAYLEIGDKLQASQLLKRLVANYPTSEEANVAKGRLAEIR